MIFTKRRIIEVENGQRTKAKLENVGIVAPTDDGDDEYNRYPTYSLDTVVHYRMSQART